MQLTSLWSSLSSRSIEQGRDWRSRASCAVGWLHLARGGMLRLLLLLLNEIFEARALDYGLQ